MSRRLPPKLSIFLALLLMIIATGSALAVTITVDGDGSDWVGVSPAVSDPNEGTILDQWDIDTFYNTNDSTHLYLRFDTFNPTDYGLFEGGPAGSEPYVRICLDTDNNTSTGFTISQCANQPGVDHQLLVWATTANLRRCTAAAGLCGGLVLGATPTAAYSGNVTEISVAVADLGITLENCEAIGSIPVNMYFDNQDTSADDNVPDSGTVNATLDCVPLAVTLAGFQATGATDHIAVDWETFSELNNVGFNLYRSDSAEGEATLLNSALISSSSPGSSQGNSYSYQDYDVVAGTTYYYWLEDVAADGTLTRHGPRDASVQSPTAVVLSQMSSSGAAGFPLAAIATAGLCLGGLALHLGRRRHN